jgi:uncharacterized protein YgiM (DUF1202 family)
LVERTVRDREVGGSNPLTPIFSLVLPLSMTAVRRILCLCFVLIGWAWIESADAGTARVSGAPLVYLRDGPGPEYTPKGVLSEGDEVERFETVGDWVRVRTARGHEGFVYGTFLQDVESPAMDAPLEGEATQEEEEPPPTAGFAEGPILDEVAALREELEALKAEIARQPPPLSPVPASPLENEPIASQAEPISPDDADLRTAAIAVFSLAIGWILGAAFTRRRSRSQRSRLRF